MAKNSENTAHYELTWVASLNCRRMQEKDGGT